MSAVAAPPRGIQEPMTKRITAEELAAMSDKDLYELVDGELKERNLSTLSSYVAGRVYNSVANFCESSRRNWVFPEGTGFQCFADDLHRVRKPDTAVIQLARFDEMKLQAKGYIRVAPDLVVEVISPNDLSYEVDEKVQEWLDVGVQTVWVIHPVLKRLSVWELGKPTVHLRDGDELTHELLPGFRCPIADLFWMPTAQESTSPT